MIDRSVFRLVVALVGGTLVLCVAGIVGLVAFDKTVPDILENVTVGALTGLVGLLATARDDAPSEQGAADPVFAAAVAAATLVVAFALVVLAA